MKVLQVVGTPPNVMKIAPLMGALDGRPGVEQRLLHTAQHYHWLASAASLQGPA